METSAELPPPPPPPLHEAYTSTQALAEQAPSPPADAIDSRPRPKRKYRSGRDKVKVLTEIFEAHLQECIETPELERPDFYAKIIALPEVVASGVGRDQVLSWYRRARKKQREEQQRKEMGKDLTQEINMSKLEGKKPIKIVAGVLMNYIQECLETPENERPEFYARIIALPEVVASGVGRDEVLNWFKRARKKVRLKEIEVNKPVSTTALSKVFAAQSAAARNHRAATPAEALPMAHDRIHDSGVEIAMPQPQAAAASQAGVSEHYAGDIGNGISAAAHARLGEDLSVAHESLVSLQTKMNLRFGDQSVSSGLAEGFTLIGGPEVSKFDVRNSEIGPADPNFLQEANCAITAPGNAPIAIAHFPEASAHLSIGPVPMPPVINHFCAEPAFEALELAPELPIAPAASFAHPVALAASSSRAPMEGTFLYSEPDTAIFDPPLESASEPPGPGKRPAGLLESMKAPAVKRPFPTALI
mmetsp:Transcript_35608/g.80317  ORF Transcript_35608/g.80317 Transcript_35608/m.80317 type:complete len:475 (+) Transcript_35608:167-1591(+)